jgi:hypothetical protein
MCREYNGWTNWETWVTKLWLDNDEYVYNLICEMVQSTKSDDGEGISGDDLQEFVWNTWDPDGMYVQSGLFCDFVLSSMNMVNWNELANAYNADGY